jgi:O-antigen/teichoic acid export membrane protein
LFNMATGLNASILFNSDKYRYGAVFLISLAVVVFALQMLLIPRMGLEGAAIATSLSAFLYNSMLTLTVWKFFRLQPFDRRNVMIAVLIVVCFFINYLIPDLRNQYLNIALHSAVISLIYFLAVYKLKIVEEYHRFLPWSKAVPTGTR